MNHCKHCGVRIHWVMGSTHYIEHKPMDLWEAIKPIEGGYYTLCGYKHVGKADRFHEVDVMQQVADYVTENL